MSERKQLSHDDYTIGWICRIPEELTAAKAMLDEVHAELPQPQSDRNIYTLGAIGGHNVVIARSSSFIFGLSLGAIVAFSYSGNL